MVLEPILQIITSNWFYTIIPESIISLIAPFSLIYIGWKVENHYVGRIPTFSNMVALNIYFFSQAPLPLYLKVYLNTAVVLGIVGILTYPDREVPFSRIYYKLNWLYCSFAVGFLLIFFELFGDPIQIAVTSIG